LRAAGSIVVNRHLAGADTRSGRGKSHSHVAARVRRKAASAGVRLAEVTARGNPRDIKRDGLIVRDRHGIGLTVHANRVSPEK
jgi:hypothetical protein